jgi:selenocysteine lyase/cysteine desulfurase
MRVHTRAVQATRALSTLVGSVRDDFGYMDPSIAFLNHGSFGAAPRPVLKRQHELKAKWLRAPDRMYFGGELSEELDAAAAVVAEHIGARASATCLLSNATDATNAVAMRWGAKLRAGSGEAAKSNKVLLLGCCYRANEFAMRQHCEEGAGGALAFAHIPFPLPSVACALERFEDALRTHRPRFALLEHVVSQPALVLPLREMVALCRSYGVEEVVVDGAHAIGSIEGLDVTAYGADAYYTNLHKWGFSPSTVTPLWGAEEWLASTRHPVTSWHWKEGLKAESRFVGTRDYSAHLAAPAAIEYLCAWRATATTVPSDASDEPIVALSDVEEDESSAAFCRRTALHARALLSEAWGTAPAQPDETVATMAMVQLPPALKCDDAPGVPSDGLRSTLRSRYGVEAAIGSFGVAGTFVRLSTAVYTSASDVERLRDAVIELAAEQEHT